MTAKILKNIKKIVDNIELNQVDGLGSWLYEHFNNIIIAIFDNQIKKILKREINSIISSNIPSLVGFCKRNEIALPLMVQDWFRLYLQWDKRFFKRGKKQLAGKNQKSIFHGQDMP